MNFIKKFLANYNKREKRFNDLSSRDKLEYYERFSDRFNVLSYLSIYVMLMLLQLCIIFSITILHLVKDLPNEVFNSLIILSFAMSKLMFLIFSIDIVINLIISGINYFQCRKWLIDKGVVDQ